MQERINLSPLHWGPKTWFFLESAAIAYPVSPTNEQKTSAKNLLLSLKDLLPCESCRLHYSSYLDVKISGNYLDDAVKDRDSLTSFIVDLHNDVRVRNGQTGRSLEDVFSYYGNEYSKLPKPSETYTNKLVNQGNYAKENLFNNSCKTTENFSNITSDMLFHFNPITLLIGIMVGLIIYKFYSDNVLNKERN
jgi:hypothetical protein